MYPEGEIRKSNVLHLPLNCDKILVKMRGCVSRDPIFQVKVVFSAVVDKDFPPS